MEWLWIPGLWFLLGAGFVLTSIARRRQWLEPEAARKALHIGMGIPLVFLPWILSSTIQVFVLMAGAGAAIAGMKMQRSRWADGLYDVGRDSVGEFAYLLSAALIWVGAAGDRVLYVAPLVVLMFADAGAALVGVRMGRWKYRTTTGIKSWEGSAAFLLIAFMGVVFPMRLLGDGDWGRDLVLAAVISLLVTMMEGASWRGWDNLFVPVAVLVMLIVYRDLPVSDLYPRLAVALAVFSFLQVWRGRTLLHQGGALGAVLAGYFAFAFGGWSWLPGPLLYFLLYALTTRTPSGLRVGRQGVAAVAAISGAPLFWAVIEWRTGSSSAFWAAHAAYATQAACTLIARVPLPGSGFRGWRNRVTVLIVSVSVTGVVPAGLRWVMEGQLRDGWNLLILFGVTALGQGAFERWQVRNPEPGGEGWRWVRHAVLGTTASALMWALLQIPG